MTTKEQKAKKQIQLLQELKQFSGSEQFYRNPLFQKFVYTEGVKHLAEQAGAYWLIDHIFSNQYDLYLSVEEFQVWKITVQEDDSASIQVEDGNGRTIKTYELGFTDFPLHEFELWFINGALLLPNEY